MRLIESINLGDIPQHEISTSSASSVKSNHYSVFSYNKLKFKNEFQIDKWIIFIEGAKSKISSMRLDDKIVNKNMVCHHSKFNFLILFGLAEAEVCFEQIFKCFIMAAFIKHLNIIQSQRYVCSAILVVLGSASNNCCTLQFQQSSPI